MNSKRVSPDDKSNGKRRKTTRKSQSQLVDEPMDYDDTENIVPNSLGPLGEAEIGIIESITLENFMCHKKLHFEFGSNVNFIIGRNGSGKSAILTGILLGLGGKANATSRGQNVKSFIATGKSFAIIELKIRNRGTEAFDPEKYGSSIIVERRISSDGSSTYKIKTEKGKTMANKKDELIKILDRFNIQVDNPVSILNQETSRNFLNSTNSQDKYRFFAKATLLESINLNYSHSLEILSMSKDSVNQKREILPTLEKEVKSKEHNWTRLQSLDLQRIEMDNLRKEYVWSIVSEDERNIKAKKQSLKQFEESLSDIDKWIKKIASKIEKCKSNKEETEAELEGINEKLNELKPMFTELKTEETKLIQDKRNKELMYRKLVSTGRSVKEDIKMLTTNIEEAKSVDKQDFTEERRIREEKIEQMIREKEELQAKLVTNQNHFEQLKGSIKHFEETLFTHKQEDRNLQRQFESVSRTLANLEASRSDRIRRYGPYMPTVMNKIEAAFNRGNFNKRPVGPIGAYVEVNDPSFNLAVECCIGNALTGFCCDNHSDEKVLLEIFRTTIKEGPKPSITVSKFSNNIYDVRRHSVRCHDHPSILNSLTISNIVAANCLIDQCEIESVLLVKDSPTARQLMLHNPPPNCRKTYTACGDLIFPAPNFRFYSSSKHKVKFLTSSVEDQINELKYDQENLQAKKELLRGQIQEVQQIYNQNTKESKSCEVQLVKTRQGISRLNLKIDELKNVVDPEPPNFAVLEEELELLKRKQETQEGDLVISKNELETAVKAINETRSKINEITVQKDEIHTISEPLREKYKKEIETLNMLEHEIGTYITKSKEQKGKMLHLKDIIENLVEHLQVLERDSLKICEKTYTEKSAEALLRDIKLLEKHIEIEERKSGSKEDILSSYENAKQQLRNIKFQIEKYEEHIQQLEITLDTRLVCLKKFRKEMEIRIKFLFRTSLSVRGYKGKLVISHKRETLSLHVQPSEDVEQLHGDTRSLSGGERSFSTVCFILSLWDAMESPFRILDEYDVFMDMVNRRLSMGMMLDTAQEKSNHQFLFLSPLDMPLTKKLTNMKICRMPDPERGQNSQE